MIIWGGCNGHDVCHNALASGGIFDPKTGQWQGIPESVTGPQARVFHTAVWAQDRMIVWGGESTYRSATPRVRPEALTDAYAFDPLRGSWSPISDTNAPSARGRHTAVWTGKHMIVWGGCDRGGTGGDICRHFKGDGKRYDPQQNIWLEMSSDEHRPAARFGHTAVWTGKYMIIWGGVSSHGVENSGGIYDPELDRWLPMANLAPSPRHRHTSVWTGSKLIVWGGSSGSGALIPNDLGEFTPPLHPELGDTGQWNVMRFTSHPDVTVDATAVWTQHGMIVWGGSRGDERFLDRGGLYVTPDTGP